VKVTFSSYIVIQSVSRSSAPQRHSTYYSHVFVLPAVVLGILVPFQFFLPPDCRERLTLGTS